MTETKTPITPEQIRRFKDRLTEGNILRYTKCIATKSVGTVHKPVTMRIEKKYPHVVLLSKGNRRIRTCMSYIKLYLEMTGVEEEEVW